MWTHVSKRVKRNRIGLRGHPWATPECNSKYSPRCPLHTTRRHVGASSQYNVSIHEQGVCVLRNTMLGLKPGFLWAILEPEPTALDEPFTYPHNLTTLMRGLGWATGTRRHGAPRRTTPSRAEVPPKLGDEWARLHDPRWECRALPPRPTLVMIEWVRQLGGQRGTSC